MTVRLSCGALRGVDAYLVDLEVDYSRQGMPGFTMVGLLEGAARESKDRVMAAIKSSLFIVPPARVTVNLAPADCRKGGSGFDLPLALAVLAAAGFLDAQALEGWIMAGELSLTGEIRPIPGVLPLALLARQEGAKGMMVPPANAGEAAIIQSIPIFAPTTLLEAVNFFKGLFDLSPVVADFASKEAVAQDFDPLLDFVHVKGQEQAKRAIMVAAAGGHNILLIGPPGSGKTMLAQRVPSILPPLDFDEALEVTRIYSVVGKLGQRSLIRQRPFRAPHHTVSDIALVGGGAGARPGEVCLAHRGVLFLDELPEFRKKSLEVLRQPLEDGVITISRAAQSLTYPADCMLVAAMNPCPCGYSTDPRHKCVCRPQEVERYRAQISGPLLDRIDLHIEVPAVPYEDLRSKAAQGSAAAQGGSKAPGSSAFMREKVMQARAIQSKRFVGSACRTNADMAGAMLEEHCALEQTEQTFLGQAVNSLALSARAYTRILRIARTMADLEQSPRILMQHLAEAIHCRVLDRERA